MLILITALAVGLLAAPRGDYALAYCARYYYAPGDRRVSKFAIYLTDLHGKGRRKLSREGYEADDVVWHGTNAVMWIESDQRRSYLLRATNPNWRPRVIATAPKIRFGSKTPGFPERGSVEFEPEASPTPLPANTKLQGINPLLLEGDSTDVPGIGHISYQGQDDSGLDSFLIRGNRISLQVDGAWYYFLPGEKSNQLWLYSGNIAASAGSYLNLYSVNLDSGNARIVLEGYSEIDFSPKSNYWAAIEGGRPLSPYGPNKQVWTAQLYVGELKIGKSWKVTDGLVWVAAASVRPGI